MSKNTLKPIAAALGTAFAITLAAAPVANAQDNPFSANELSSGYMLAEHHEGKCGEGKSKEGKCGESKGKEGKCGNGNFSW